MEPRYRTILPIVGILFVIIVALIAFFIARRVRNAATGGTPSPTVTATSLVLPSPSPSTVVGPTRGQGGSLLVPTGSPVARTMPRTGPEDETNNQYAFAFDDVGIRQDHASATVGTMVTWYNLGLAEQSLTVEGLSSGPIKPGASFSYQFAIPKNYTIQLSHPSQPQTIVVQ